MVDFLITRFGQTIILSHYGMQQKLKGIEINGKKKENMDHNTFAFCYNPHNFYDHFI